MGVEGTGYRGAGARKNKKWERYGRPGEMAEIRGAMQSAFFSFIK